MFYPPKGTEVGPIVFTYVLFLVRKRILAFQFSLVIFETLKMFYCADGVGLDGPSKRFFNFLILRYISLNKKECPDKFLVNFGQVRELPQ